jgi:hypothetical protein
MHIVKNRSDHGQKQKVMDDMMSVWIEEAWELSYEPSPEARIPTLGCGNTPQLFPGLVL